MVSTRWSAGRPSVLLSLVPCVYFSVSSRSRSRNLQIDGKKHSGPARTNCGADRAAQHRLHHAVEKRRRAVVRRRAAVGAALRKIRVRRSQHVARASPGSLNQPDGARRVERAEERAPHHPAHGRERGAAAPRVRAVRHVDARRRPVQRWLPGPLRVRGGASGCGAGCVAFLGGRRARRATARRERA